MLSPFEWWCRNFILPDICKPCLFVFLRNLFYLTDVAASDPEISFYMENINDAQCVLTVQNGKASASASVTGRRGAERCKIVLEIQKKQGSQWITVDSWSVEKDGRNANLSKSVQAKKGTTYRAKVKVTVWLDGKSESKTITTSGKTA